MNVEYTASMVLIIRTITLLFCVTVNKHANSYMVCSVPPLDDVT